MISCQFSFYLSGVHIGNVSSVVNTVPSLYTVPEHVVVIEGDWLNQTLNLIQRLPLIPCLFQLLYELSHCLCPLTVMFSVVVVVALLLLFSPPFCFVCCRGIINNNNRNKRKEKKSRALALDVWCGVNVNVLQVMFCWRYSICRCIPYDSVLFFTMLHHVHSDDLYFNKWFMKYFNFFHTCK